MAKLPFHVSANALVVRDNKILLGKKKSGFAEGNWMLPGGKLEYYETVKSAAARELEEETGILALESKFTNVVYDKDNDEGVPNIHFAFLVTNFQNEPEVKSRRNLRNGSGSI